MIDVLLDPQIWLIVLILSIVGAIARLTNYFAGSRGKQAIIEFYPRVKAETWDKALRWYDRLGPLPLLIASIPIIGTLITISAGMAGVGRNSFLFWVTLSKVIRNWFLVLIIWWFL